MEKKIEILWLGGDKRQIIAENVMHDMGWNTAVCANRDIAMARGKQYGDSLTALSTSKVIVFPLPVDKDTLYLNGSNEISLSDILDLIKPSSLVFGGKIPPDICVRLTEKNIRYIDYYTDEFQIRNALPSAEGAIGVALCEMPITLSGSQCFVVGYGRIGKLLALKLQLLGANVIVGARKPTDLAFASVNGHKPLSIADGIPCRPLTSFDAIFNTAPIRLFDRERVRAMRKETLYFELASAPYGIDFEAAEELGLRVIRAEGLPGKYSPISAGKILAESVVHILSKEGITP